MKSSIEITFSANPKRTGSGFQPMTKGGLAATWEGIQADQSPFSSLNRSFRLAKHGETGCHSGWGQFLRPGFRRQVDGAPVQP